MSLDFFTSSCSKSIGNLDTFGLCDNQTGTKAYFDVENTESWIASVVNSRKISLTFTAIDKCVIQDNEYPNVKRCDCLLTSSEHLYFVELKDQARAWVPEATKQLESTIELFIQHHDISVFRHKKAFACNKQHKHFQEVDHEDKLRFFRNFKVRIDVQAEIIVI